MNRGSIVSHGVALALTVVVVVAVAAGAGAVSGAFDEPPARLDLDEFDPAETVVTPSPRTGEVAADVGRPGGTVLVDDGHGNRFTRASIEPIVGTLAAAGWEVQFYTEGDLLTQLRDVDAFLVVDPATEYLEGDVDDVQEFTRNGGRLVVLAEPTRIGSRGAEESAVTSLASAYGVSVDTRYLYQLEGGGASYKHVVAAGEQNGPAADVAEARLYIAGAVDARGGTTLLRTAPGTHKSSSDDTGAYPVAVQRDDALVVGDASFAAASRFAVADNEAFVAYVVEFLAGGDYAETGTANSPEAVENATAPS